MVGEFRACIAAATFAAILCKFKGRVAAKIRKFASCFIMRIFCKQAPARQICLAHQLGQIWLIALGYFAAIFSLSPLPERGKLLF